MTRTRPPLASTRLIDRRDFMRAAGAAFAAALAPRQLHAIERADAVFATAYQEKDGQCGVGVLSEDRKLLFTSPLPDRGHDVSFDPVAGRSVVFARRPGTFAVVFDHAGKSQPLTITCQKTSGGMGGCAEDPGMAAYEDGSYPNAAVIQVPALQPGETFDHVLEFWGGLVWGAGTYELTLTADAGDAIAEDDEENNQTSAEKQQLAGVNKTPQPKGPGTIILKPKSGGGGGFPFELQFTFGQ